MPNNLPDTVKKALKTKLPKLLKARAVRRVLLFERDQIALGDNQIYEEVVKLLSSFPDIAGIDELWLANTAGFKSEGPGVLERDK